MSKKAFEGIKEGLKQAIAFADGTGKRSSYRVHIPPDLDVRKISQSDGSHAAGICGALRVQSRAPARSRARAHASRFRGAGVSAGDQAPARCRAGGAGGVGVRLRLSYVPALIRRQPGGGYGDSVCCGGFGCCVSCLRGPGARGAHRGVWRLSQSRGCRDLAGRHQARLCDGRGRYAPRRGADDRRSQAGRRDRCGRPEASPPGLGRQRHAADHDLADLACHRADGRAAGVGDDAQLSPRRERPGAAAGRRARRAACHAGGTDRAQRRRRAGGVRDRRVLQDRQWPRRALPHQCRKQCGNPGGIVLIAGARLDRRRLGHNDRGGRLQHAGQPVEPEAEAGQRRGRRSTAKPRPSIRRRWKG